MRYWFIIAIALLLFGCSGKTSEVYCPEKSESLIIKITSDSLLTEEDYQQIIGQLDGMLESVCNKAEVLLDSGYRRTEVRTRLKMDSSYMVIYRQSGILDSAILEYINTPDADPKLRTQYKEACMKYYNKATRLGLN